MTAIGTATDFLTRARRCGALPPTAALPELPDDTGQCAVLLVAAGLLTDFQSAALLAGTPDLRLGPYVLLRKLGEGGMGQVFLARHADLGRTVAVKLLTDPTADPLARERFRREARAAAALDHPNVVRLYDIRNEGGVEFLVMEAVDGIDLQRFLRQKGSLPHPVAAGHIVQAATGLAQAHARGIIHRDIKPANLMLTPDGTVKVLDLGLARSESDPADQLTSPDKDGAISGTIDYLSPEQAMGDRHDRRADVYSLGATLAALVTGGPPYTGTAAQKLLQHQLAPPPNVHLATGGRVPADFAAVVARLMAKRPGDRPASATEVIRLLAPWARAEVKPEIDAAETVVSGGSGSATVRLPLLGEVVPVAPARSRRPRNPRPRGWAVAAVLTTVALAGATWVRQSAVPSASVAAAPEPLANGALETVYATRFAEASAAEFRVVGGAMNADEPPPLPLGWSSQVFQDEALGTFTAHREAGGAVLSVSAAGPGPAAQWVFFPAAVEPRMLLPGTRYRVELEFFAESQAELKVQELDVWAVLGSVDLPAIGGWSTAALTFITPPSRDCNICIRPQLANGKPVRFRQFRIVRLPETSAETPPDVDADAARLGEFVRTVGGGDVATDDRADGWHFRSFKAGGEIAVEVGTDDGRKHLALRNVSQAGAQAHRQVVGPPLRAGVAYRVTVEYRSAAGTHGSYDLRDRDDGNWAEVPFRVFLPSSDGRWETRHYEIVPSRDWMPVVVFQNLTADAGNELAVRRLTVTRCPSK